MKDIAEDYFNYLARRYPVMCASDEFYFVPRAKSALNFLDVLDSFNKEKIQQGIADVSRIRSALDQIDVSRGGLEEQIDAALLKQSMATFLNEFSLIKSWQVDPSLYLKVILFGIIQAQNKFKFLKPDLRPRIAQIPRLLEEARANLNKVPQAHLDAARELVEVILTQFKKTFPKNKPVVLALAALGDFSKFLRRLPATGAYVRDQALLRLILRNSFSYQRSLREIFDIAWSEYHRTLKQLKGLALEIDRRKSWQKLLEQYRLKQKREPALVKLYAGEVEKLRRFLQQKKALSIPVAQSILVGATPDFLRPVRASASYSTALTSHPKERPHFYITPSAFNDIHIEYLFVSAHETYPGHHLLDLRRRKNKNTIRQQIESPLFYEGWASYAERLIDELGYIRDPLQRLIGLRRQAWRAVRAMLDVGIRTNQLSLSQAQKMLEGLGYQPEAVRMMLRHYVLTVGYQLCYTTGKFEFERLNRQFAEKLGLKRFHDLILSSGQIPFSLLERRLKA
ncbi:DUF885 family protein [Candidatus Omnitrophota bacterium]